MAYDPSLPPYSDSWSDMEICEFRPDDAGTHGAILKITRKAAEPEYRFVRRWRKESGVIRCEVAFMRDPAAEAWLLDGVSNLSKRMAG